MITARYRNDYDGEFIVLETKWSGGKKQQEREWVPNPITNTHISGRAACIGHDIDRPLFNFSILQRHRGGLLGSKKLQTYGVGDITPHLRLDFAVEINSDKLNEIKDRNYQENNIVYTTPTLCIANPGDFYLIPYNPRLDQMALLPYLAAFDNHREVFLLGYTEQTLRTNSQLIPQLISVFSAYSNTKFFAIGRRHRVPKEFFNCVNFDTMEYRSWISYADI